MIGFFLLQPPPTDAPKPAAPDFVYERKVAVGDSQKYEMKMLSSMSGVDVLLTGKLERKVLGIDPDGTITLSDRWTESLAEANEVQRKGSDLDLKWTVDRLGNWLKLEGPDLTTETTKSLQMIQTVTSLISPGKAVKEGENWTIQLQPKAMKEATFKLDATYVGVETVGDVECYRLNLKVEQFAPDNTVSNLKVWLQKSDQAVEKLEGTINRLRYGESKTLIDSHYFLTRVRG
jgi:hypothetical protein